MKTKKLPHYGLSLLTAGAALFSVTTTVQAADKKPNILVVWGDDVGTWNISHNNRGMMGYQTPNIDRIAREGVGFTDYRRGRGGCLGSDFGAALSQPAFAMRCGEVANSQPTEVRGNGFDGDKPTVSAAGLQAMARHGHPSFGDFVEG